MLAFVCKKYVQFQYSVMKQKKRLLFLHHAVFLWSKVLVMLSAATQFLAIDGIQLFTGDYGDVTN